MNAEREPLSEELDVLKTVTRRLGDAGIPYMVTGSIAMNFYAVPRMTRDIDIVVELEISDTDPGVKGDTASGGGKPATLVTGAIVRVPLFVDQGETIKVDTRSKEYVSRVK